MMATFDVSGNIAVVSRLRPNGSFCRGGRVALQVISARLVMTYKAAHRRIRRLRGRAALLTCVDCNGPAHTWSYNGHSEFEQTGTTPKRLKDGTYIDVTVAWSALVWDYSPCCYSCHRKFDAPKES